MAADAVALHGFAYGEVLEGPNRRSLGYRLLAPAGPVAWGPEVESLARRLQAAPYPDPWPPVDLFCSVLLADGQRLVALARYGLADQTPGRRRGGLELVGVVGPGEVGVPAALAVYRWLRQRRAAGEDLRNFGGRHDLSEVLAAVTPEPLSAEPVPVLPIRVWGEGVLLFAATAPSDSDHHLSLLQQGTAANWQWLPLVGADFPLPAYAKRGPVIAWTPHLAGVAVKLEQSTGDEAASVGRARRYLIGGLVSALLVLLAMNWWSLRSLSKQIETAARPAEPARQPAAPDAANDPSAERFARALSTLPILQGRMPAADEAKAGAQYERLASADPALRLGGPKGKEAVTHILALGQTRAGRVEALVREALEGKGYDPQLIELVCRKVRAQLGGEGND